MDETDRYSNAKETLRGNVKWMSGSFAGLAALILAGTPFTSYGALEVGSERFVWATTGLVVAIGCLLLAWAVLLWMLRPDAIYNAYLRSDFRLDDVKGRIDRCEIKRLRETFEQQRADLLPRDPNKPEGLQFDDLQELVRSAWNAWMANTTVEGNRIRYERYQRNLHNVQNWAGYTRLHQRVSRGMLIVGPLGTIIVFAICVFAWTANPPKDSGGTSTPTSVVIQDGTGCQCGVDVPALNPVLFQLGRAHLTEQGWRAVNNVRDLLRDDPALGILLLAHTDTLGGESRNQRLARDRADVVRAALTTRGGIAESRVFITELPERALPIVTDQEVNQAVNRAVEFIPVKLKDRKHSPATP